MQAGIPANKKKKIRRMEKALRKLQRREHLLAELGYQGGTVYERHIAKIRKSTGYIRAGNLSHYAAIMPSFKTHQKKWHNSPFMPSRRDRTKLDSMENQEVSADSPRISTGKPNRYGRKHRPSKR